MNAISKHLGILGFGVAAAALVYGAPAGAKVEGDTITLGAALSLTGKYTTAGNHTKKGYEMAVKLINDKGIDQ